MWRKILWVMLVIALAFIVFLSFASSLEAQEGEPFDPAQGRQLFAPTTQEDWQKIYESVVNASQPQIAFEVDGNIYVINQDGTNVRQVLRGASPSFSPDGKKLVFVNPLNVNNVTVLDFQTGGMRALPTKWGASWCTWSPDGEWVAYSRGVLFLVSVDGSRTLQLTDEEAFIRPNKPAFSPDGKIIAFSAPGTVDGGEHIFTINIDGTNLMRLTEPLASGQGAAYYISPSWSPDGREIVYGYYVVNPGQFLDGSIRKMKVNGSGKEVVAVGFETVDYVAISPNNQTVAVFGSYKGRDDLYAVDFRTGSVRLIYGTGRKPGFSPTWFDPHYAKHVFPEWDVNQDGVVDISDLVLVAQQFGESGKLDADVDVSGMIDIADLVLVARHFGEGDGFASPSIRLSDKEKELVEKILNAKSEDEALRILRDFVPEVRAKGKLPTTWGAIKRRQ